MRTRTITWAVSSTRTDSVENLSKSYGHRTVVDQLTFDVRRGETFALLGPNGAGKTTTVEILEGYRKADGGRVTVLGLDPNRDHTRLMQRTGLMLQEGGVFPDTRAHEALAHFASFYGVAVNPTELLARVGLEHAAKTPYKKLSQGQQQRLSLALALVGDPELVFLDEPTAGMDPHARHATWDIIRALKSRNVTLLLTTHFMDEAERLADRVAIIDHGKLLALDEPAALMRSYADMRVFLNAQPGLDTSELSRLVGVTQIRERTPGHYEIATSKPADFLVDVTKWFRDHATPLQEIRVGTKSLEEVFLQLTGRELRE